VVTLFRMKHVNHTVWKRMVELMVITFVMATITFVLPLIYNQCTPIPLNTADWTTQQVDYLDSLVQFQCDDNHYNQVASLYFTPTDIAMQQLYHFKEVSGSTNYTTFDTGALLIFFIPYFFMAAITAGTLCPAGLFVPTLLAGSAFGRIVGHILNSAFAGYVTDSGTYALVGASALLGGMSRMTIAGTVIILEASGYPQFLLPLMITFAAARYTGNAINEPMYDMHIHLKAWPFLEGSLKTLGLLNYHPIAELMAQPVITLDEINRVGAVHQILSTKTHNGFPVVGRNGHLRGFILRKTLCNIIKLKAFSAPVQQSQPSPQQPEGDMAGTTTTSVIQLAPAATVFHDTLERNYPHYPKIEDISLSNAEMNCWLDVRPYMDTAPYAINASSSVQRCYRFFRTLGLRHLIVLDGDHRVIGIVTRKDITEQRLEHHWFHEGDNMQKFISIEPMEPGTVHESTGLLQSNRSTALTAGEIFDIPPPSNPPNNNINSINNTNKSTNSSFSSSATGSSVNPMFEKPYEKDTTTFAPLNNIVANPSFTTESLISPLSPLEGGNFVNNPSNSTIQPQQVLNNANSIRARELKATKEPKSVRK